MSIAEVAESLAAEYLGRFGIVAVGDGYDADGTPFVLVHTTSVDDARAHLPATSSGFRVEVHPSTTLLPLEDAHLNSPGVGEEPSD